MELEKCGIIVTGKEADTYQVIKYKKFDMDTDLHTNILLMAERYGICQILNMQHETNVGITGVKLLYGNIAPMAAIITVAELLSYNPIVIKLDKVPAPTEKKTGSYLNKMSHIFPFFRVFDHNLLSADEVKSTDRTFIILSDHKIFKVLNIEDCNNIKYEELKKEDIIGKRIVSTTIYGWADNIALEIE